MSHGKNITLKEALSAGKLEQFIQEREHLKYDPEAFNSAIEKLAGKSKATQATSSRGSSGNYSGKKTRQRKQKDA